MKTCRTCLRSKPESDYTPHHDLKDGLDVSCRSCRAIIRASNRVGGFAAYIALMDRKIESGNAVIGVKAEKVAKWRARREEVLHIEEVMQDKEAVS